MLLIDFNQVVISNFMTQVGAHTNVPLEEGLLRHMILNTIRLNLQKFGGKSDEVIICCDSKKYWRREVFPYYKASRKKDREASGVDWTTMFNTLSTVRSELQDNFPYKTIMIEGAEADDIIGTLVHKYHDKRDEITILSSDKDFMQLQVYPNVKQYSPVHKKFVRTANAEVYLKEHIIKGDRGDGIPNVASPDSVFVTGGRQKPMRKKMIEQIANTNIDTVSDISEEIRRNYARNRQLVDLSQVPDDLQNTIVDAYENYKMNDRSKLLNYFIKYKLKNLMDNIGEF
jgi:5'-3' exonuclease